MKLLSISLFGLLALGGCGKGDAAAEYINGMKSHADKMCKCTDAACAEKAHAEKDKWEESMESKLDGIKPTEGQEKAFSEAEDRYRACRAKAEGE